MRARILTGVGALSVMFAAAVCGRADPIALVDSSLSGLFAPDSYSELGSLLETDMSSGNLYSEVHSRAYSGGGKYVYLYQVFNTGTSGNSSVEQFTLGEFAGSIIYGDIGLLTGTLPDGFSAGGQPPYPTCRVNPLPGGVEASFYYSEVLVNPIDPGEHSRVMFIRSTLPPGLIDGSVINHNVGTGHIVGAVPEPGALVLLVTAGLGVLAYSLRRRQRRG